MKYQYFTSKHERSISNTKKKSQLKAKSYRIYDIMLQNMYDFRTFGIWVKAVKEMHKHMERCQSHNVARILQVLCPEIVPIPEKVPKTSTKYHIAPCQ